MEASLHGPPAKKQPCSKDSVAAKQINGDMQPNSGIYVLMNEMCQMLSLNYRLFLHII